MAKQAFDIRKHNLVPKHAKVSDREKKTLLEKYNISVYDLPLIRKNDPGLVGVDVKPGDIVKIIRQSPTAGEAVYYRCVINV
ncbi:DNA-directed RNA polymerase subunit H [Candidatus Woesearchaeota archaeon]|nr:DNA-directed RNA polymerase subunit H [Candidatus Woesearchaeota archaeon]